MEICWTTSQLTKVKRENKERWCRRSVKGVALAVAAQTTVAKMDQLDR